MFQIIWTSVEFKEKVSWSDYSVVVMYLSYDLDGYHNANYLPHWIWIQIVKKRTIAKVTAITQTWQFTKWLWFWEVAHIDTRQMQSCYHSKDN